MDNVIKNRPKTHLRPIQEVAADLGIEPQELDFLADIKPKST